MHETVGRDKNGDATMWDQDNCIECCMVESGSGCLLPAILIKTLDRLQQSHDIDGPHSGAGQRAVR